MKFAAAAITPGRANVCQNGTEPSAKSTQIVPLSGTPQMLAAAAWCGAAANPAHAASRMSSSLFKLTLPQSSSALTGEPPGSPVGPLLASVAGIRTAPEPAKTSSRTSVIRARNAAAGGAPAAVRLFDCLRLFAVERAVDLGDLLGLGRLVRLRFVVLGRL